jgi:hypothetical protein
MPSVGLIFRYLRVSYDLEVIDSRLDEYHQVSPNFAGARQLLRPRSDPRIKRNFAVIDANLRCQQKGAI